MSRPRYPWWGYVKSMIRRYPAAKAEYESLHEASTTARIEATGHGSGVSKPTEGAALRELPATKQREYEAVRRAIAATERFGGGGEILRLVDLVFWKQTHTLQGAAIKCHVSYVTASRWHGEFVRLVASYFGLMDE